MWFDTLLVLSAAVAGAIAAVTGFGIGSLLTPILALQLDSRLAVAAVSIPHVVGTALRFWLLQSAMDRRVLYGFGLTSAAGGLCGAVLQGEASNDSLTAIFGAVLVLAAVSELRGRARPMRFHGSWAWIAGAASGLLGGLVGNQGGIRSAALLGFGLTKQTFVGTATAIALFVDGARVPIYLATQYRQMERIWPRLVIMTVGVVLGTAVGSRALSQIPDQWFRYVLALVLMILGGSMLVRALA